MRKQLTILLLFLASVSCAYAETIILRTGARVKGEIVFQNEEVIIFRDASGARSQYPRAEVLEIVADVPAEEKQTEEKPQTDMPVKKVSILLELAGGAAIQPKDTVGGTFSVDFLVGSHHIGERHIFVGAGVGYHGLFLGAEKYNFLPIMAAVRMPLLDQKHAPVFGLSLGYGIALSKTYLGGLYAGFDFGYRCQLNPNSALALTAFAQFQQARVTTTEYIIAPDDPSQSSYAPGQPIPFVNTTGRSLISTGLKLSLYF